MPETDLYGALNLTPSASHAEIQAAFKQLSRVFHPDKLRSSAEPTEEAFKRLRLAHDVLIDSTLRLAYDHAGMKGVNLVYQSHFRRDLQRENKNEDSDSADGDEDDLYILMHRASNNKEAKNILDEALQRSQAHYKETRRPPVDIAVSCPHVVGDNLESLIEQESASLQIQTSRKLGTQWESKISASSQLRRNGTVENATSLSMMYHRPGYGPVGTANLTISPNMEAPILKLQTDRLLSTGSSVIIAMGGALSSIESWSYSFISSRRVLLFSKEKDGEKPTSLTASWNLTFSLLGGFQFFRVQLAHPQMPKWNVGAGLDSIAASYETDRYLLSMARSWRAIRYKTTWKHTWNDWTLDYGLGYDSGQALLGNCAWKILIKISSEHWDIRFPLSISPWKEAEFVSRVAMMLIGEIIDDQLDLWNRKKARQKKVAFSLNAEHGLERSPMISPRIQKAVCVIAKKKRAIEESQQGLVIVKATWSQGSASQDVTDILQFWTSRGRLHLPVQEGRWWQAPHETERFWTWNWEWLTRIARQRKSDSGVLENAGLLQIRYGYKDKVFDVSFEGDELLWLPNERATLLGDSRYVQ